MYKCDLIEQNTFLLIDVFFIFSYIFFVLFPCHDVCTFAPQISDDEGTPSDEGSDGSSGPKSPPRRDGPALPSAAPHFSNIAPHPTAVDEDPKICPMCNQSFSRDITQDMFENHVIAHFEDINVGFEVV